MSEYKEFKIRLNLNIDLPEQKLLYDKLNGFSSAQKRNKEIISILTRYFSGDMPELSDASGNGTYKSGGEASPDAGAGDLKRTIDYLYNHIRLINDRLNALETQVQPETPDANMIIPAEEAAPDVTETKVLPIVTPEKSDPKSAEPDIDIPDDILDYLNNLK